MTFFTKKSLCKVIFNAAMNMVLLLAASSLASAQEGARVYLQPVDSTDGRLTVDIMAENVTDMYGTEVHLAYDPAVVSVQDANPDQEGIQIEAGHLLPVDQGFVAVNRVNESEGTIVFAMTLLNPAPPVTGSGPLARVTFIVPNNTSSTINFGKVLLINTDLQHIPHQTVPLAIGDVVGPQNAEQQGTEQQSATQGTEQQSATQGAEQQSAIQQQPTATTAPPPATTTSPDATDGSFPWWIVAAGIIILGLVGLGALMVRSGLNKSQQTSLPQPKHQPPRQQPQQPQPLSQTTPQQINQQRRRHVPGTRPSAFK